MLKIYRTDERLIEERSQFEEGVWVALTNPSVEECQKVSVYYDIDVADF